MSLQHLSAWITALVTEPYHALRRVLVARRNRSVRVRFGATSPRNLWSDTQ